MPLPRTRSDETTIPAYNLGAVRRAGLEDGREAAPFDPPSWGERIYAEAYEKGFQAYLADR